MRVVDPALHQELTLDQAPAGASELAGLQAWAPAQYRARLALLPAGWLPLAPLALSRVWRACRDAQEGEEQVLQTT